MLRETAVPLVTLYARSPPIAAEVRGRPGATLPSIFVNDNVCIMRNHKHRLDALERLDPEWERAVRDLHRTQWRQ